MEPPVPTLLVAAVSSPPGPPLDEHVQVASAPHWQDLSLRTQGSVSTAGLQTLPV
jgi:hypothetical protein